jgi:hypothetical protein
MSLRNTNETATIICDKCGTEQTEPYGKHNEAFFNNGWTANFRAKKYVHVCYDCKNKKEKKTHQFIIQKFGLAK